MDRETLRCHLSFLHDGRVQRVAFGLVLRVDVRTQLVLRMERSISTFPPVFWR